jgi:hypothetical protein
VTQLYASNGCLLLTDWLLTMVKVNSVRNRQFVVCDTGIVYIVVAMVVRRSRETRVVRQSLETKGRETRCVVSNRMSDRYAQYRMFVTIIEFCVIYLFWALSAGLCSADWDGLIRCYDGCETWLY